MNFSRPIKEIFISKSKSEKELLIHKKANPGSESCTTFWKSGLCKDCYPNNPPKYVYSGSSGLAGVLPIHI